MRKVTFIPEPTFWRAGIAERSMGASEAVVEEKVRLAMFAKAPVPTWYCKVPAVGPVFDRLHVRALTFANETR
jgi:hypothetical protein